MKNYNCSFNLLNIPYITTNSTYQIYTKLNIYIYNLKLTPSFTAICLKIL